MKILIIGCLALGLANCGTKRSKIEHPHQEAPKEKKKFEFYPDSVTGLSHTEKALNPKSRVFLVAGSYRGANFAQEILEQKNFWIEQGIPEGEIACYYAIPDKENYDEDKAQYESLKNDLSSCYPAHVGLLKSHLEIASKNSPTELYIYISTHGSRPFSYYSDTESDRDYIKRFPVLDEYDLQMSSDDAGTVTYNMKLQNVADYDADPDDLFLTPRNFKAMLGEFSSSVNKTVVIQACYSGGFIDESKKKYKDDSITSIENLTVLTAAIYYRSSFGCNLDADHTYFGGFLLNELKSGAYQGTPSELEWLSIYNNVTEKIEAKERANEYSPSLPQYFTNK